MVKQFLSERFLLSDIERIEQAVVNIHSLVAGFNWKEPYLVRSQHDQIGTGFFIDEAGHLLTNAHVVDQAKSIELRVPTLGRRALRASIIGFSPDVDVALLKVQEEDLAFLRQRLGKVSFLPLGDSDKVSMTELVLVLGYPLGQLNVKGATGIMSGYEPIEGASMMQITAPINFGNSGGPLLNEYGQVIGITVARASQAHNIGYALPINAVKVILEELYEPGLKRRPSLGILFNYTTEIEAAYLSNPAPGGLFVNRVCKDTIAERMDIQEGDMIYEINGCPVDSYGQVVVPWKEEKVEMRDLFAHLPSGSPLTIVVYRNGKKLECKDTFSIAPVYAIRQMYPDYEEIDYEIIAGVVIMQLTDNHLELLLDVAPWLVDYALIENKVDPVIIISRILPGSQGDTRQSLTEGQVVRMVNNQSVSTLQQVRTALEESLSSNYVTIKTAQNVFVAFTLANVISEASLLAQEFKTPITPGISILIDAHKK